MKAHQNCFAVVVAFVLASCTMAASAQWTDAGWTHYTVDKSSSGTVINPSAPGVSASAPSSGLTHTWITESYSDVMASKGVNYNCSIVWSCTLSGSVTVAQSASSGFTWSIGSRSSGITSAGSYSASPDLSSWPTVISPPGGTATVSVSADAQNNQYASGSTAYASSTADGSYNP